MAEVIQCPACLQWLNLEFKEARIICKDSDGILYKCQKCGNYFDENGEVWQVLVETRGRLKRE